MLRNLSRFIIFGRSLATKPSAEQRLINLVNKGNYFRSDSDRVQLARRLFPLFVMTGAYWWAVYQIKKASAKRTMVLPGFLAVRDELPFIERTSLDYFQKNLAGYLIDLNEIIESETASPELKVYLLQCQGIKSFEDKNYDESKKILSEAMKLCNDLKREQDDFLVINLTFYLSQIAVLEDDLQKGLSGLLFCASQMCGLRKSRVWESLSSGEYYSYSQLALKYIAKYVRVASNAKNLLGESALPFSALHLDKFAAESMDIFEDLLRKFFNGAGNMLSPKDESSSELYLLQTMNDFLYQELSRIPQNEPLDHVKNYIQYLNQRFQTMRTSGRSMELHLELYLTKINEAFLQEKEGKLEEALRSLNTLIHSTSDVKVINLAKLRKNI